METDQIIQDLNRRFQAPLPDFYRRRVIFWYDEEREFEEQIGEVSLDCAEVVILTGSNSFAAKKYICEDNTSGNILVYCPLSYEKKEDDWLLNVELYSEEYRADLNSLWMSEMGLPATPVIRRQLKTYRKFFAAKDRRAKVAALAKHIQSASHMHLAVMAAICGVKELQTAAILRAVLCAGLDDDTNTIYTAFVNYGADKPFWIMVRQNAGYDEGDESSLSRLASHLLLTASTRTLRREHLTGLDALISTPHNAYCYDIVSDWMRGDKREKLYETVRRVEDETRLAQRFRQLGMDDLRDTEVFPCIHEVIAEKLMTDVSEHIIDTNAIASMVEKRRTMVWFENVACYYEGLLQ
ncbi:MAG: BREX-1 system phosphatase PglZ type A, partial [Clostridia bacterium]|nr:BREX-1 system phosphatase PglZ type A [Clostridia bacterium]